MRMNVAVRSPAPRTHEGAPAARIGPELELRRLCAACLLWEDGFYESGKSVADRIGELVPKCRPEYVAAVAYEARTKNRLRHLPLLLVYHMTLYPTHNALVAKLLPDVIQRADEIAEFVAIYWSATLRPLGKTGTGKHPLAASVKRGLAAAFLKFDAYQLAKYDRNSAAVKLRDVLFLVHGRTKDTVEGADLSAVQIDPIDKPGYRRGPTWRHARAMCEQLVERKLAAPDTWEVALSKGGDKATEFERLMAEGKLGGLAFLRNLRNMRDANIAPQTVMEYASRVSIERILPFRFIAAARAVPEWEHVVEPMMLRALEGREKFAGKTIVLVDVSHSMDAKLSAKSDITRLDAACGVAILLREACPLVEVITFSDEGVLVAPRRGFALRDAIVNSQSHRGTYLGAAVAAANKRGYDRLVVITDEQSNDPVGSPLGRRGYMVNVAANRNGVGYGPWNRIDGWSEAMVDYIAEFEKLEAA